MPAQKRRRYQDELGLSAYDARFLTEEYAVAVYRKARRLATRRETTHSIKNPRSPSDLKRNTMPGSSWRYEYVTN